MSRPATAARRRAGRAGLLVPLYVHPATDPGAWAALVAAAPRLRAVVLNAADGPGRIPDPAFTGAVAGLRGAGVPVLGYVDTAYGHRPAREVVGDVRRHRKWYGVDGVFLDQTAAGPGELPYYRRLVRLARALGAGTAVLNPGTHPDPGYAHLADVLVTFEGDWEDYRGAGVPAWTADHPPERFCHLVHGVPREHTALVARTAERRGAAVHCAVPGTGANPWRSVPGAARTDPGAARETAPGPGPTPGTPGTGTPGTPGTATDRAPAATPEREGAR
ncbi:spherulation-specific family 4 protein [Streptomyces albireticuli]|uniref:spherulation-specific family 4 protein n=1 Tax=Streptomyces albireticuli TaxID=1940 RepID=UPI0036D0B6D3